MSSLLRNDVLAVTSIAPRSRRRRAGAGTVALVMLAVLCMTGALVLARRPAALGWMRTEMNTMLPGRLKRVIIRMLALLVPASASVAQPTATVDTPVPRAANLGVNLPEVRYYSSNVPFANLVMGSGWLDARWAPLAARYRDGDGNIVSLPADGAQRFIAVPPTGPEGVEVRCTFTGSGTLGVAVGRMLAAGPGSLRFRTVNQRGKEDRPWLTLKDVDPRRPMRDLDCREAGTPAVARFRPHFLDTVRGYGVIRFMDWQNANANEPVTWATRNRPGGTLLERDGVAVEDMLALVRELDADAWFVMPWNADDTYIAGFAQAIRAALPPGRHVYVEAGNEVWNLGFPVGRQALKEGRERGLGGTDREAAMHRYAQRTIEVMRIWERAFAGREQALVRVLATQQVVPETAQAALGYADTAAHVDALATSAYFGETYGGTADTRESVLAKLAAAVPATLAQMTVNRRIAASYGKRFVAYEGGEALSLPAQPALLDKLQHDAVQYDLVKRFLTGWRDGGGDTLCLFNSVARPGPFGAWGLAAWENETPAEAPKMRAAREALSAR